MLNAIEPGTFVPIHRHPTKDESFVVLPRKVKVSTYNDDGSVIERVAFFLEDCRYGADILKNVWHNLFEEHYYDENGNLTETVDMMPGGVVLNIE